MKIHKSDAKAVAAMGCKTWREIMGVVADRAIERAEVLVERHQWNRIQNESAESWE